MRNPTPTTRPIAVACTIAIAIAIAAALAACGVRIGHFELRFDGIDRSAQSGIDVAWVVVVRDPGEWERVWRDHDARRLPSRPVPYVDFGREIVAGVFLGRRTSTCHEVRIERVVLVDDHHMVVRYREVLPPPGDACGFALSYPADIVRIPYTDRPLRFEELAPVTRS
jgi:hypothetical protein